jgi:hypothetical protein
MRPRAVLSIACFTGLVIASVRLPPLMLPFIDRTPIQRSMSVFPDRGGWWPDYPRFLAEVHAQTKRGDSIAILVPTMQWSRGYSYAYYRASYFLAGREVLPLVLESGLPVPENLRRAQYVAMWRRQAPAGAHVVFTGYGGTLVRR